MADTSSVLPRPTDRTFTTARTTSNPATRTLVFDLQGPMIVAIDGPAGTGKSSVARDLAAMLGLDFLDTGAMYRAAAVVALDGGLWPRTEQDYPSLVAAIREANIRFDWRADPPAILAFGKDVSTRIRTEAVTEVVSPISAIKELRELMVEKQRRIGQEHPRLVTEGRDQGSIVFPDAQVKFYLDARADVRARRRAEQLREAGVPADEREILEEIVDRDRRDMTRDQGRLFCPPDAIRMDTSDLSKSQVIENLARLIREVAKR